MSNTPGIMQKNHLINRSLRVALEYPPERLVYEHGYQHRTKTLKDGKGQIEDYQTLQEVIH